MPDKRHRRIFIQPQATISSPSAIGKLQTLRSMERIWSGRMRRQSELLLEEKAVLRSVRRMRTHNCPLTATNYRSYLRRGRSRQLRILCPGRVIPAISSHVDRRSTGRHLHECFGGPTETSFGRARRPPQTGPSIYSGWRQPLAVTKARLSPVFIEKTTAAQGPRRSLAGADQAKPEL